MGMLVGFRFLAGTFGVSPITLGGGTIADMIAPARRGAAMAIWAIGRKFETSQLVCNVTDDDCVALLGPVIGPVAGGFLSDAEGWRW